MRALLAVCLIALPAHALAHDEPRDIGDALVATGYVGGTGTLFGLAGGVVGGLVGWGISPKDCPDDAADCGSALPLLALTGLAAGMLYGMWKGGVWFDEAEHYDGSYLGSVLGFLIGGAAGGALANEVYDASGRASWGLGVGTGIWVLGLAAGAGAGWLIGGDEKQHGAVSLDLPMVTPVGEGGFGLGLSGRF